MVLQEHCFSWKIPLKVKAQFYIDVIIPGIMDNLSPSIDDRAYLLSNNRQLNLSEWTYKVCCELKFDEYCLLETITAKYKRKLKKTDWLFQDNFWPLIVAFKLLVPLSYVLVSKQACVKLQHACNSYICLSDQITSTQPDQSLHYLPFTQ